MPRKPSQHQQQDREHGWQLAYELVTTQAQPGGDLGALPSHIAAIHHEHNPTVTSGFGTGLMTMLYRTVTQLDDEAVTEVAFSLSGAAVEAIIQVGQVNDVAHYIAAVSYARDIPIGHDDLAIAAVLALRTLLSALTSDIERDTLLAALANPH